MASAYCNLLNIMFFLVINYRVSRLEPYQSSCNNLVAKLIFSATGYAETFNIMSNSSNYKLIKAFIVFVIPEEDARLRCKEQLENSSFHFLHV